MRLLPVRLNILNPKPLYISIQLAAQGPPRPHNNTTVLTRPRPPGGAVATIGSAGGGDVRDLPAVAAPGSRKTVRFAEDVKPNDLEGISCGSSGSSSDDECTRVLSAAEITASKV